MNFGGNFGANFARSSNVMATVGKNEGITQSFTNYTIKHTLEILEQQMKRYEQSTALGMWDFAAYVLSEDTNVANNVAHSYLALTQGEQSYMSQTAVNLWRGDMGKESDDAKEICSYLRELRHPLFGLSPALTALDSEYNAYPAVILAATSLSGKELAYSLNFPQKSVAGLPVIECAEFGRNVISYEPVKNADCALHIGNIFHMNRTESALVRLTKKSLCSHTFITGSTGSGKSNTVCQILNEALEQDIKFLVIEPAKGEYKQIFGNDPDVNVYGTNPYVSQLLRLNPFSFPQAVFDVVAPLVPKGWIKLVIYLEYGAGSYSFSFYYSDGEKYIKCFDIPGVLDETILTAFGEIDKIVSPERDKLKGELWSNMTMVVNSGGNMHTDFDYTDLSMGTYQYKKDWKKKYLV